MKTIINTYTRTVSTTDGAEPIITGDMIERLNRAINDYPNAYGAVFDSDTGENYVMFAIVPLTKLFPRVKPHTVKGVTADEVLSYSRTGTRRIPLVTQNTAKKNTVPTGNFVIGSIEIPE